MRRTGLIPPITAMSDSGVACSPRPRSDRLARGSTGVRNPAPTMFAELDRPCSRRRFSHREGSVAGLTARPRSRSLHLGPGSRRHLCQPEPCPRVTEVLSFLLKWGGKK